MFQKFWMNNVSHFFLRFFVVVDKRIGVLTVSGQFAQIAGSFSNTRHKLFLLFKNKFTIPRIKIKQKTFCGPHFKAAGFDQTPNLRKSRIPHSFERKKFWGEFWTQQDKVEMRWLIRFWYTRCIPLAQILQIFAQTLSKFPQTVPMFAHVYQRFWLEWVVRCQHKTISRQ